MSERHGLVSMQGNPLTLTGNPVGQGDQAPDFTVLDNALQPVTLKDYSGKVLILASVPSLDTSVCSEETKRFNAEADKLDPKVSVLTISMDLPFAQKRWVDQYQATNVTTLSDHKEASFGLAYGVLITELRLLARAVFVVGLDGRIGYTELVSEVTNPPDYESALQAARSLL
jgi:thiol peroxidase